MTLKIGVKGSTTFVKTDARRFSTSEEEFRPIGKSELSGMNLLVVDESPDNRQWLSVMLRNACATYELAADGVQGVEMATASSYQVIMDVQRPRMDGYQGLELLKKKASPLPLSRLPRMRWCKSVSAHEDVGLPPF